MNSGAASRQFLFEPVIAAQQEYLMRMRRLVGARGERLVDCHLGRRDLGALLLARLRSGMHDPAPEHPLHYYQSQSAVTRARLAAWHLHDPAYTDRPRWVGLAHSYLEDAAERIAAALAGCRDTAG